MQESVTITLERYEEMKQRIDRLTENLDYFINAFSDMVRAEKIQSRDKEVTFDVELDKKVLTGLITEFIESEEKYGSTVVINQIKINE
ncbi:hypothetical protein [Aneurinibacillus aneurinilyticus]|uniref:hypothetical protein n=1 Tax=Aneurinibacillus aneurinilyticus TaxID=1391 RepID=UPI0035237C68